MSISSSIAATVERAGVEVFDLTHPISPSTPVPTGYPPVWFATYPPALPDGAGISELVLMGVHVGTHVDAPAHFAADGLKIDELLPLAISGPAIVLDFEHDGAWQEISADDIERWEEQNGETIHPGDIVLLRTGHGRKWKAMPDEAEYARGPWRYLGSTGIDLLLAREIKALGVETPDPDRRDPATNESHYRLLPAGIPIIENLASLADIPRARCTFLALPLPYLGASASPVRAVALV